MPDKITPGPTRVNTNVDSIIFKDCEPIVIPKQLANLTGTRFIRIKDGTKIPADYKWNTERNYQATNAAIKGWTKGGHPYGIVTGLGGLCCLDIDEPEVAREIGLLERLPTTFVVTTGGGGQHHWLEAYGIEKMILYHNGIHIGEFQAIGSYAMGPGSTHPNGNKYEICENNEIAKITKQELISILTEVGIEFKKKEKKEQNTEYNYRQDDNDVDLLKLCMPDHAKHEGNEWIGEHPIHGATHIEDRGTSRNFSVNPKKGQWYCFAHETGGTWVQWIAIELGKATCATISTTKLTRDDYFEIYEEATRRGLISENPIKQRQQTTTKPKQPETTAKYVDELKPILPKEKTELWIASPRTGKTYTAAELLVKTGEGNYFAPNHEIVRHAMSSAVALGATACVHTEGKRQPGVCRQQGEAHLQCASCLMKPVQNREEGDIGETWAGLKKKARDLIKEKKVITKENVPIDMCPYFTLLFAEEYARYKFTVINNINSSGIGEERSRKLTVIDEDTCMNFFYPQTVQIATVTMGHGKVHITTPLDSPEVMNRIVELERQDRPRLKKYAMKMREMLEALSALDGEKTTVAAIEKRICDIMESWEPKIVNLENEEYGENDDIKFGDIAKCMMYPYKEQPVTTKTKGFRSKVYLMADEQHAVINMDWFQKAEKIVIIGAARAELFVNEFGGTIREVEKFRFEENFTVISVGEKPGEDGRGKKGRIKRKLIETIKLMSGGSNNETMIPMMVLVGSEEEQDHVSKVINNGTFKCTSEGEKALKRVHVSGLVAIYYANSRISRGLDVDQYNVLVAVGTDFAQPFYSAVDQTIEDRITIDEITNSVLRISPTRKQGSEKAKVIIISEDDEWKIKYLKSRIIRTQASAKGIARTVRDLGIAGESKISGMELKIAKSGTHADGAYMKIFNKLSTADDIIDDETIEMRIKMILNILRDAPRRWIDTNEIKEKTKVKFGEISLAVEAITHKKMADITITKGTVKLKHKKQAKNDVN